MVRRGGVGLYVAVFVSGLIVALGILAVAPGTETGSALSLARSSLDDLFGTQKLVPVYEIDLSAEKARVQTEKSSDSRVPAADVEKNYARAPVKAAPAPVFLAPQAPAECDFSAPERSPTSVIVNEIAWMGAQNGPNSEWIELKNASGNAVSVGGWHLLDATGRLSITFAAQTIAPNGFYLAERTDDSSVPTVTADSIYVGALSNSGAWLKLFDSSCALVDEINAAAGWSAFGGDNQTKQTLERNANDFGWHTGVAPGGTPKAENSVPQSAAASEPPPSAPLSPPPNPPSPPPAPPPSPPPSSQPTSPPPAEPAATLSVRFSEVMAGSTASSDDEFIELYNPGTANVLLTGWSMKKKTSTGKEELFIAAKHFDGKIIPARGYFLLAHDGSYSGAVTPDVRWPPSYSFAYSTNTLMLYDDAGTKVDEVLWTKIKKDGSITRVSWDGPDFVSSTTPTPQNSGAPQ